MDGATTRLAYRRSLGEMDAGEAAVFPEGQLSKETGSPEGSMSTDAGGLGWAWCRGQGQ